MSATVTPVKGTRKTYSFAERELLVNLIYKYLINNSEEERNDNSDAAPSTSGTSATVKRKSLWAQLTDEYNSQVGAENTRSCIQLRRCWENMKTHQKKYREEESKKAAEKSTSSQATATDCTTSQPSAVGGTNSSLNGVALSQPSDSSVPVPMKLLIESQDGLETDDTKNDLLKIEDEKQMLDETADEELESFRMKYAHKRKFVSPKSKIPQKQPKIQKAYKTKKSNNEMHEYTMSEAQLKLDTAAILKEEAKLRLEEAEYKKEEAKMRMICASYKLQKLREEYESAIEAD
ncbi:uncharacterized protein LOC106655974 [Trichogramma pretiosum]|uniref:uncharacterized protein LOC106655974 n=1 Tax=Trichogramma pretiosum TaxID=7493 RepID=UPI0006C997B9|nr:uncharacterized protein LOC106655974 [Trichogramma pretiosum]